MIDILENHLKQCVTAEQYEQYMTVFEITEQLGLDGDEYYNNLFMMFSNEQIDNLDQAIHEAVMSDIYGVLSAHGIGVDLDATIAQLEPVLRFLVMIEDTEFTELLNTIVQDELTDHAEKLAGCIQEVVGVEIEAVLPVLIEVPETVILSIKRYIEQRRANEPKEDDYSASIQASYIKALTQYVKVVQGNEMRCYQHVLIDDVTLGLPLDYYWALYNDYLTTIPMEAMIYELIGFCLISEDNDKNPTTIIGPIIEKYYGSDIDQLTQANIIITNTLINLRNAASSGMFHAPGQN